MNTPESSQRNHLLSGWKQVAAPAAWLLATFGFVLAFPVRLSSSSSGPEAVVGIAGIVVAVVIAILHITMRRKGSAWSQKRKGIVLVATCLFAFVASWGFFDYLKETWTCNYTQDVRLVVGTQPTPALRKYVAASAVERGTASGVCRMVLEYAGDTLAMYEYEGLASRYYGLVALYLAAWLALAAVVIGTVNLLSGEAPKPRARANRKEETQ